MRIMIALVAFCACVTLADGARAANCSATMSDMNFGNVSIRAGEVNRTSGELKIACNGALVSAVGVCVRFGAGSGGAGAGNNPRYMRRGDGAALAYQLRLGGAGAAFGTLNQVFVSVPILLGGGSVTVPVFGEITSASTNVGSGAYASAFSGTTHVELRHGLLSCDLFGQGGTVAPFDVSANVVPSCELDVTSLNFGRIDSSLNAPVDAMGAVNVRCTADTGYTISLGPGQGPGVTDPEQRRMRNGGSYLGYGLYMDSARSQPWGWAGGALARATGTGLNQSFGIFGRIHAGQNTRFGTYQDSVVVTVNY